MALDRCVVLWRNTWRIPKDKRNIRADERLPSNTG
jgi:hypothetical protein